MHLVILKFLDDGSFLNQMKTNTILLDMGFRVSGQRRSLAYINNNVDTWRDVVN